MAETLTRVKPVLSEEESGLDEFTPDKTSNRVTKEVDLPIAPGWARRLRPRSSNGAQLPRFTVPDDGEELIVKFLDDAPFAPIYQHWFQTSEGRRAFTCAGLDDCPMCARGNRPKAADYFNIVVLGEKAELNVWIASPDPSAAIEERADSKRTSPINKPGLYFAVSKKKGTNGFFSYTLDVVKEDELHEEWGVEPLTSQQLSQFEKQKFDSSAVRLHTISELTEASKKYIDSE